MLCCRTARHLQEPEWNVSHAMATDSVELAAHVDSGFAVEADHGQLRTSSSLNMNHYANKKSAAESMLDLALLMANASQLKAVLHQGPQFSFYTSLITLISLSLCLQIFVGVLLIFIVKWNVNDEERHRTLNIMENITTACIFVIVVINVFITAFGVQQPSRNG